AFSHALSAASGSAASRLSPSTIQASASVGSSAMVRRALTAASTNKPLARDARAPPFATARAPAAMLPWHSLYRLPLPQGQGSFLGTLLAGIRVWGLGSMLSGLGKTNVI